MKMDKIASSGNDEFYTPKYAVDPIIDALKRRPAFYSPIKTVWCPFDNENSLFVKMLRDSGYDVINSHIESGTDFFDCEVPECDAIISNPPYSKKNEVFERLFSIGKPFAMLVGVVGLFESQRRFNLFKDNSFEVMYMNRRVAYFQDFKEVKPSKSPPFSSVYLCQGVLNSPREFATIDNKDYHYCEIEDGEDLI